MWKQPKNRSFFHYFFRSFIHPFIHSSETPPRSVIWCFLFQFLASFHFRKVIQSLIASSSCHSILPHLTFCNVFHKAVSTKDVTNPVALSSIYCMQDVLFSSTLCHISQFPTRSVQLILSILLQHHIKTFCVFLIYFPYLTFSWPCIVINSYNKTN